MYSEVQSWSISFYGSIFLIEHIVLYFFVIIFNNSLQF